MQSNINDFVRDMLKKNIEIAELSLKAFDQKINSLEEPQTVDSVYARRE